MKQERAIQNERLREHVGQMSTLERAFDQHRLRVEKLLTVYGLESESLGHGGLSREGEESRQVELPEAQRRETVLRGAIARLEDKVQLLARFENENASIIRHTPSILPLPATEFVMTAPFGRRVNPFTKGAEIHKGIDLAAAKGTPVFVTADGIVTFAGRVPLSESVAWWRLGNVVVVSHGRRFLTIYGHCDSVKVRRGDRVLQGTPVAGVGSTGWSTNSHLHYEVRSDLQNPGNFRPVDPRIYILNYEWSGEDTLLARARALREATGYDPLPRAFVRGRN